MTRRLLCTALLVPILLALTACQPSDRFSGQRALKHVKALCDLGPRPVGTEANREAALYIQSHLETHGWEVETQDFAYLEKPLRNVIGKRGSGPLIILGTHYDTRPVADLDPVNRAVPVLGANDGASGVAVLLELASALSDTATEEIEVWLAFFDGEDHGEIGGWPWCVGSAHMARNLTRRPEYVLIVDMVGDADQQIFYEWTSSLWLQEKVWRIADELGYGEHFIPKHKHSIIDDHTPFLQWGMNAALIIDFDYPYWHTTHDTVEKISAESLHRVGHVLQTLIEEEPLRR